MIFNYVNQLVQLLLKTWKVSGKQWNETAYDMKLKRPDSLLKISFNTIDGELKNISFIPS